MTRRRRPPSPPASAHGRRRSVSRGEKQTLGFYLTGHPIESHLGELSRFCTGIDALRARRERQVVCGTVLGLRTRRVGRGETAGFALIDDRSGRMEASFFAEVYERDRGKLEKDRLVIVEGEVQNDDYTGGYRMVAQRALTIEEARGRFSGRVAHPPARRRCRRGCERTPEDGARSLCQRQRRLSRQHLLSLAGGGRAGSPRARLARAGERRTACPAEVRIRRAESVAFHYP